MKPCSVALDMGSPPQARVRWFHLTPDRVVIGLLPVEGLLWLSDRFQWFPFNAHRGWTVLITMASVGVAFLLMLLWFSVALVFRWRFQFSIWSLLVLVVAVALPCSWLAVEMKKATRQKEAAAAIVKVGGVLGWDLEPRFAWLRSLLGEDLFKDVYQVDFGIMQPYPVVTDSDLRHLVWMSRLRKLNLDGAQITDTGLEHLKELTQLEDLMLGRTKITDAGLQHIGGMKRLEGLWLENTQITDAGLERLKEVPQLRNLGLACNRITDAGLQNLSGMFELEELSLEDTQITDVGLEHLRGLVKLKSLDLNGTEITDVGLEHLKGLNALESLHLPDAGVTDKGVKELHKALPNCEIDWWPARENERNGQAEPDQPSG